MNENSLELIPGKYYLTREMGVVGPLELNPGGLAEYYPWSIAFEDARRMWAQDGRYYNDPDQTSEWDLLGIATTSASAPAAPRSEGSEAAPQPNGGHTGYYDLPPDATQLNDLIEAKGMSFARGNIFKAVYRLGEKPDLDPEYDINKIIYFAERLRGMSKKGEKL